MKNSRHRVGIMGGTFDPVHIGHLMLAERAYEQFDLETVLFMPSGNPPHKRNRNDVTDAMDRLEMVRLAIQDNPHFSLDAEEILRGGYSYTNETLRILREENPDTDYYFIIGGDSLMSFDTWVRPDVIAANCILLAAVRDGLDTKTMELKMQELQKRYGADVRLLHTPDVDISSSQIRTWNQESRSIRYFVPDAVLQYIREKGLYRTSGKEL